MGSPLVNILALAVDSSALLATPHASCLWTSYSAPSRIQPRDRPCEGSGHPEENAGLVVNCSRLKIKL